MQTCLERKTYRTSYKADPLELLVRDKEGNAVDLADVDAALRLTSDEDPDFLVICEDCEVNAGGEKGVVRYDWPKARTIALGKYTAWFLLRKDGEPVQQKSIGPFSIEIET